MVITRNVDGIWYKKNSWGTTWAEEGHYKVKFGALNERFAQVFYLERNLPEEDRRAWRMQCQQVFSLSKGSRRAKDILSKL